MCKAAHSIGAGRAGHWLAPAIRISAPPRVFESRGARQALDRPSLSRRQWEPTGPRALLRDVYLMRMARVNVAIPDDLLARARAAGVNVSRVSASALSEELDRRARIAALDSYLAELDATLGPVSAVEQSDARAWADAAFGDVAPRHPGPPRGAHRDPRAGRRWPQLAGRPASAASGAAPPGHVAAPGTGRGSRPRGAGDRGGGLPRPRARHRAGLDPDRPARPPRRALRGPGHRGRLAREDRAGGPGAAAHRGAGGAGAVRRGAEGLERDAAQAQPRAGRAHLRPGAPAAQQRGGGGSRTSPCGTSATSATRRSSA